ncbi:four helix bundle protein [Candidatus Microgenomates bacterium]|nr:four helix bundle protein [Candidatus Microgenomates bacterium]
MSKTFKLEDINAYRIASELSDYVWEIVSQWPWFAKKTLGTQFVDAADSIAANIAEGYGRYHKKDKVKFYYNSRASVFESAHWCKKAFKRKLISVEEEKHILSGLRELPKEINTIIKLTMEKLKR